MGTVQKRCSTRTCFSPIHPSLAQSYSSSPELWWRPRRVEALRNVALGRGWGPSTTPWCLAPFMETFPATANASMVVSTPSLTIPAKSFALQKVISQLSAYLTTGMKVGNVLTNVFAMSFVLIEEECRNWVFILVVEKCQSLLRFELLLH